MNTILDPIPTNSNLSGLAVETVERMGFPSGHPDKIHMALVVQGAIRRAMPKAALSLLVEMVEHPAPCASDRLMNAPVDGCSCHSCLRQQLALEAMATLQPGPERNWYVLTDGEDVSGPPKLMTDAELAVAQDRAELHGGGVWGWEPMRQ